MEDVQAERVDWQRGEAGIVMIKAHVLGGDDHKRPAQCRVATDLSKGASQVDACNVANSEPREPAQVHRRL